MAKCFLIKKNKEYKYFGAKLHGYYYSFVASHSCAVVSLCSKRMPDNRNDEVIATQQTMP